MDEVNEKLDDLKMTMGWLIKGIGIHGLKISDIKYIDWDWVCENYNVDDPHMNN